MFGGRRGGDVPPYTKNPVVFGSIQKYLMDNFPDEYKYIPINFGVYDKETNKPANQQVLGYNYIDFITDWFDENSSNPLMKAGLKILGDSIEKKIKKPVIIFCPIVDPNTDVAIDVCIFGKIHVVMA